MDKKNNLWKIPLQIENAYLKGIIEGNLTEILQVQATHEIRIERNSEDITEIRIVQGHTSDVVFAHKHLNIIKSIQQSLLQYQKFFQMAWLGFKFNFY